MAHAQTHTYHHMDHYASDLKSSSETWQTTSVKVRETTSTLLPFPTFPSPTLPLRNGNRTEWSPIRSVIIRVITRAAGITSMITDRIGRHEVLLPINHINYNFRENYSQVMRERGNSH